MTRKINSKNLYIVVSIIFIFVFIYDLRQAFQGLSSANQSLSFNKYAAKIEATKKLIKIFDQPFFDSNFFKEFKSYGEWPLNFNLRPRGPEIFSLPETAIKQLLDLSKTGNKIPVKK
jgi:hypothetical protein